MITVEAEVVGGTPAPTSYQWTVQQPDGSFSTFSAGQAGSGSTSVVRILSTYIRVLCRLISTSVYEFSTAQQYSACHANYLTEVAII